MLNTIYNDASYSTRYCNKQTLSYKRRTLNVDLRFTRAIVDLAKLLLMITSIELIYYKLVTKIITFKAKNRTSLI